MPDLGTSAGQGNYHDPRGAHESAYYYSLGGLVGDLWFETQERVGRNLVCRSFTGRNENWSTLRP
jgi:hypothetical protein